MKFLITISRTSSNQCEDKISLTLVDKNSHIQFVDIVIPLADFASILTGMSHVDVEGEVRGLQYVGKHKVTESRSVESTLETHDRDKLSKWVKENCQEEGWVVEPYLGSQNSISYKDGKQFLHYNVVKYVDKPVTKI